jgi:spore coat protein CotF
MEKQENLQEKFYMTIKTQYFICKSLYTCIKLNTMKRKCMYKRQTPNYVISTINMNFSMCPNVEMISTYLNILPKYKNTTYLYDYDCMAKIKI